MSNMGQDNLLMPSQWMPQDPEVADVSTWGTKPLPKYTSDMKPDDMSAAEERIAANQSNKMSEAAVAAEDQANADQQDAQDFVDGSSA